MDYKQRIVEPIKDNEACGSYLEEDAQYQNFFFMAQGTPEKFDGENTIPAEPPEWRDVKQQAIEYLSHTKDLKLLSVLSQAVLNTEGIIKFSQCLGGIAELIQTHWSAIYPSLDEDEGDPLERISALSALNERHISHSLKTQPILSVKGLGTITYQTIVEAKTKSEKTQLNENQLRDIFRKNNSDELQLFYQASRYSITSLVNINNCFTDQAGHQYTIDFTNTMEALEQICAALEEYADQQTESMIQEENNDDDNEASNKTSDPNKQDEHGTLVQPEFTAQKITSRKEVQRCLEMVNDYYSECEPSSPIPVLVNRVIHLIDKDFLDIMKDLYPDALPTLYKLGGLSEMHKNEEENSSDDNW